LCRVAGVAHADEAAARRAIGAATAVDTHSHAGGLVRYRFGRTMPSHLSGSPNPPIARPRPLNSMNTAGGASIAFRCWRASSSSLTRLGCGRRALARMAKLGVGRTHY
jgi:hypothetical protein